MMLRLFQHLLPRGLAWRTTIDTTLRRFFEGLSGLPTDVRQFADLVYLDLLPPSTRELAGWESEFALSSSGSEAIRRLRLAAAWRAQGGQSPDYIQTIIHEAGFTTVFVHEWWESGPPYVSRNPHDYTTQPLLGSFQCEDAFDPELPLIVVDPWQCFDPGPGEPLAPHCDDSLINDPLYFVNEDLSRRAPPPIPDDPNFWPYFLYFTGETFGEFAFVEAARIEELRALILSLKPAQQWIVLLAATYWISVQSSGSSQSALSSSGYSTSATLGPGSNRVVLVATSLDYVASNVTAVTYGGQAMSLVTDGTTVANLDTLPASDDNTHLRWWILREANLPSDGVHNIVTTVTGLGFEHGVAYYILEGANQSPTVETVSMGFVASSPTNLTVSATGLDAVPRGFVAAISHRGFTGTTSPANTIGGVAAPLLVAQDQAQGGLHVRVFHSLVASDTVTATFSDAVINRARGIVAISLSPAVPET